MKRRILLALLLIGAMTANARTAERRGPLRVSDNGRYLQYADAPLFCWSDTAWELFHRLDRDEADLYIADRAAKVTP